MTGRSRFDVALEALAHVRRRTLLLDLCSAPEVVVCPSGGPSVTDEAENTGETDKTDGTGDGYPQLFHIHLPKLVAMGYVEWDRAAGTVRAGDRFEEVAPLLGLLDSHAADLPDGLR